MNKYISRTKDVILDYLSKAQMTERKIDEGRSIYQPDSMEREEKRLRGELAKSRQAAEAKIESIYQEASSEARKWGELDGKRLTEDAELLRGEGVTPSEFSILVERYQDNYTMLDTLRKYGERKNTEAIKEARKEGNRNILTGPYDVSDIPGPDHKLKEWDDMKKNATYFLNVADGTGFASEFEKSFARGAADKQFDAWGEEAPEVKPADPEETVAALQKAWGFGQ